MPLDAKPEDLRTLFEKFGVITECDVLNRFGFVHMKSEDMAKRAIAALHNTEFMGSRITVEVICFFVIYFYSSVNVILFSHCSHQLAKRELVVVVEVDVVVVPQEMVVVGEVQLAAMVVETLLMVEADLHLMIVQEV